MQKVTDLVWELATFTSTKELEGEAGKVMHMTTEMFIETVRREMPGTNVDQELVRARGRVAERIKKVEAAVKREQVAEKLEDATKALLLELRRMRAQDVGSKRKAFDDVAAEVPEAKRSRIDQGDLERKFEALGELRKEWKATTGDVWQ